MHNIIFSCGYFLIIRDIPWSREILNTNTLLYVSQSHAPPILYRSEH